MDNKESWSSKIRKRFAFRDLDRQHYIRQKISCTIKIQMVERQRIIQMKRHHLMRCIKWMTKNHDLAWSINDSRSSIKIDSDDYIQFQVHNRTLDIWASTYNAKNNRLHKLLLKVKCQRIILIKRHHLIRCKKWITKNHNPAWSVNDSRSDIKTNSKGYIQLQIHKRSSNNWASTQNTDK